MRLLRRWSPVPLALTVILFAAPLAAAKPAVPNRVAPVKITRVAVTPPRHGRSTLLVEARYPIALVGHRLSLRVFALDDSGKTVKAWRLHPLANAAMPEAGLRRQRFRFVHRVALNRRLTRDVAGGLRFRAEAIGFLDTNGDGKPEMRAGDGEAGTLTSASRRPRLCSSVPQRRTAPGQRVVVALPVCSFRKHWKLTVRPRHGSARIRHGKLIYRPAKGFRGTDALKLGGAAVVFKVGAAPKVSVRAMGDSVTAGFGYYDNGKLMPLLSLPECKPGSVTLVDACSSNSKTLNNEAKQVEYAPDYGLANNVSWVAQWANEYGITNFENLAISGSEPVNWAPGGSLYKTTQQIESENPDYIVMTLGANPLLSEMLFGVDNMGCAFWSRIFGEYEKCIEKAFEGVHLRRELERVYTDLVQKTTSTIYLMQYHLSVPSSALAYSALQIAQMGNMLNDEIASVAAAVNPKRLRVVTPPHFNVGIDLEPLYTSSYSCSRLGYKVDGPSVQSTPTQDELLVTHPLSFCSGPAQGPPWVISGDTGIHPSATGYTQMASQVPAPR